MTISKPRALGRLPARVDSKVPALEAVLTKALPTAKSSFDIYEQAVGSKWILGHNDTVGDCTCAGVSNIILGLTTSAKKAVRIPDDAVLALYESITGYNPANPSSDTGALIEDVLAYWHGTGVKTHVGKDALDKINGFATVDHKNHTLVKQALEAMGPLDVGIDLPSGWEQSPEWLASNAGSTIAGGHCITMIGYNAIGPRIVSWGEVFQMDWEGWDYFVMEAHVLLSKDILEANGKDASGVNWTALEAFMQDLKKV